MSGIAGILYFNAERLDTLRWQQMQDALAYWGPDGCHTQQDDHAAFAFFHLAATPEATFERQPRTLANGEWLVAAARLDNRDELCDALHIDPARRPTLADGDLIEQAYLAWGQDCVKRLYGDWAFAVWNPNEQRLFLARDQIGQTALFYHTNQKYIAFASGRKALLALNPALHAIDDLYVAQVMLSWPVFHGPRTVYQQINRLPPAHTLTATPHQFHTDRYWHEDEIGILPLRSREEAVEGFLALYEQAVATRLRTNGPVCVTLSGGLDSGSVTALAAAKQQLTAYTSVPIGDPFSGTSTRFGDEWEHAAATAAFAGVTNHQPIRAEDISPLEGIAHMLWAHDEPQHAASNAYWIASLLQRAKDDGNKVLLTGQGGNATVSWTGTRPSKRRKHSLYHRLRQTFFAVAPTSLSTQLRIWRINHQATWRANNAISHDLVQRSRVVEASLSDPFHPVHIHGLEGLPARYAIIKPGRSILGSLWHENSAAYGIDVRDPTLDLRLVQYCLSIPEHLFYDAENEQDRSIIRQAMAGRMPDSVRLNSKRGVQGADIVHRLRLEAPAVEATLEQLAQGTAAEYLNLANLRQAWVDVQQQNNSKAYRDASIVLLRGIMVGLFVQQPIFPRSRPASSTRVNPTVTMAGSTEGEG